MLQLKVRYNYFLQIDNRILLRQNNSAHHQHQKKKQLFRSHNFRIFFPKIRYSLQKKAGLLACVLLFTFPSAGANSGFVVNNKLISLQLREQLRF
jgi:hypothetical protein